MVDTHRPWDFCSPHLPVQPSILPTNELSCLLPLADAVTPQRLPHFDYGTIKRNFTYRGSRKSHLVLG